MTHYVAHLKVERVEHKENRDRGSANHGAVSRDVSEVTQMTIKGSTLDILLDKLGKHVEIIAEEEG